MDHTSLYAQVIVLLLVSVFVVSVCRRAHLPPIIGYFGVGMITGPHGMAWVSAIEDFHILSEFGVVFLLFTIGLEFSLSKFWRMRRAVLGIGGSQVIVTACSIGLFVWLLVGSWETAVVVGGALAMSSTAIVIKQLQDQVELRSRHGQLSVGILLFQDLAVVPFLVVIPLLGETASETPLFFVLTWALVKGAIIFVSMISLGHWVIRPLFDEVALARSTELFTLTVLLVTLGAAFFTAWFGLSLALGAFLAGMMLSETQYKHQIELDIRPFQDLLLGLFFIMVGMMTDFHTLISLWYWVLPSAGILLIIKSTLIYSVSKAMGIDAGVSLRAGLVLSQGGEFGFVLLALALNNHVVAEDIQQFVLGTIFTSMLIAPILIRFNGYLARFCCGLSYKAGLKHIEEDIAEHTSDISSHIIICGFGQVGQKIAKALKPADIRWVALDLNPDLVKQANAKQEPVSYGDSCRPEVLIAAGVERANAVVVTFIEVPAALKLVHQLRQLSPNIPIIVRTLHDRDTHQLKEAGATEVIPDLIESSLILVSRLQFYLEST